MTLCFASLHAIKAQWPDLFITKGNRDFLVKVAKAFWFALLKVHNLLARLYKRNYQIRRLFTKFTIKKMPKSAKPFTINLKKGPFYSMYSSFLIVYSSYSRSKVRRTQSNMRNIRSKMRSTQSKMRSIQSKNKLNSKFIFRFRLRRFLVYFIFYLFISFKYFLLFLFTKYSFSWKEMLYFYPKSI